MNAIGIDIGGTKTLGCVINENGKTIDSIQVPTRVSAGKAHLIDILYQIIQLFLEKHEIRVIGIGSAGRVDVNRGSIYYATSNLPDWTNVELRELIYRKFKIPVIVDNDVNVAGIGEKWLGSGKGYQSFVLITLGTGIASAVYINNQLIRGARWGAGEIGHMILYPHGKQCNCGQRGCLEQYCCGTALYKNYNEKSKNHKINSGKEFFSLIKQNDIVATVVLDQFIDDFAIAITSLCNIYDPEVFIIGGGLLDTKQHWWDPLIERINRFANPAVLRPTLLEATFKNNAGTIGAAKLGFDFIHSHMNEN